LVALVFHSQKIFATGESCSTSYSASPVAGYTQNNYLVNNVDKSVWISFVANESAIQIYTYELASTPGTVANEIFVYSGSCGSATLINSLVFDYMKYGNRTLYLNGLITGNTYFVKLIAASTNSNISLSITKIGVSTQNAPCSIVNPNFNFTTNAIMPQIPPNSTIKVAAGCTLTIVNITQGQHLLSNCRMEMGNGSKIIATDGLKLTNGTRIYSCTGMWQGIDFLFGDLVISQNSLISDAEIAVNILGGFAIIEDAIFNRNRISIVFNNSINSSTPVIPIRNTILTSRDFFLTYTMPNPNITFLKSINPSTGLSYLEGYPLVGLQNANLTRSFAGIQDFHLYNTPLIIGQFPLSSKDNNIFENHDFGIISRTTRTTCVNNVFRFMPLGLSSNPLAPYNIGGVGIIADGGLSTAANSHSLKAGDLTAGAPQNTNTFFNCWRGIVSQNYSNNIIHYNSFGSDDINNFPNFDRALFLSPTAGGNTTFEYNTVDNLLIGVRCLIPTPVFTYTNFSFSYNTFSHGFVASQNTAGFSILINGLASSTSIVSAKINNNTISNASSGILIRPLGFKTEIKDNIIALLGASTISANGGVSGIEVSLSNNTTVTGNNVSSNHTSGSTNRNNYGIFLFNSYNCKVHCNSVSNVSQGFVFSSTCTSTGAQVFRYNAMSNCRDGLVLLNGGSFGPVGNSLNPGGNTWAGYFDNSRSLADMSNFNFGNPALSYFYCKPGTPTTPPIATNLVIPANLTSTNRLNPMPASGPDIAFCSGTGGGGSALEANSPEDVFKELIVDAAAYTVLELENEWANKKSAYEALSFDSSFANINDPDLIAFVADAQNENYASIAWTDEMLKQYDYYFAKYLVNGLSPQNLMEQNYKTFTNYYILWCENPEREFSMSEINDLYAVANQCANLGGKSVLQAQVFLDYILHQDGNWNTNCPIPASSLRKALQKNKEQLIETDLAEDNFEVEISPNPANDIINLTNLERASLSSFAIIDIIGNQILTANLENSSNLIDVSQFANGIYFINLRYENGKVIIKKLTIAHN
jgi:hypothetical protein